MSALTACQAAITRLVGQKPTTVFSSTNQLEVEIAELATDVAIDIMKSHDWRALTKIHTITGDGSATAFPLPEDYDRMVQGQSVADANNWLWGYTGVADLNDWITITTSGFASITPGWWIILDGQFQFSPAPTSGADARFPYISKNIATQGTMPIAAFSQDSDEFKLEDRLLTLGLIWRWRAQKRMEFAEDLQTYEIALSQAQSRDRGARVIRSGNRTVAPLASNLAWPWPLG